jgi:hypothetical protein
MVEAPKLFINSQSLAFPTASGESFWDYSCPIFWEQGREAFVCLEVKSWKRLITLLESSGMIL